MTQELAAAAPDAAAERAQPASRPAAAAAPAAVPTRISRRNLLLAAAVVTVWALFTAAHLTNRPLFLVRPPITRRSVGFYQFPGAECSHAVALGAWTDAYTTVRCTNATAAEFGTCGDTPQRHWHFSEAAQACGTRRFSAAAARQLLAGQLLVFAGDSIARSLYGATLRLLGTPGQDIVVGHQDFAHELEGGISLQFLWAPYPANLTAVLGQLAAAQVGAVGSRRLLDDDQPAAEQQAAVQLSGQPSEAHAAQQQAEAAVAGGTSTVVAEGQAQQQQQQQEAAAVSAGAATDPQQQAQRQTKRPSLVTLSGTLWHLLHTTAAEDYEAQLTSLGQAAAAFAASTAAADGAGGGAAAGGSSGAGRSSSPRLVLASGTEMFPNRMKTIQKQHSMTPQNLDAYNRAMQQAGLLAPAGPFALLDLFPLTQHCGEECSTDGVHSMLQVYDAALQLLLNVVAAPTAQSGSGSPAAGSEAGAVRRRLREQRHVLPWRQARRP